MTKNHIPRRPSNGSNDGLPAEVSQAVVGIAELEAPADAVTRLIESASVKTSTNETVSSSTATLPRTTRRTRSWRWAAVAAIVAGILMAINWLPSDATSVYAKMQEAMANVKTIQCVSRILREDELIGEIKSFVKEPRLIRQEMSDDLVVIADLSKQQAMSLNHADKTARYFSLAGPEASEELFDAINDVLRGKQDRKAEQIGKRKTDGLSVAVYEVRAEAWTAQIEIDSKTNLPLKVILPIGENGVRIEASQFVFDQELDPALFALTPPAGYKVSTDKITESPKSIDNAKLVLTPETGLGEIKFGMSTAEVIQRFGEPEVLGHPMDQKTAKTDVLNYNSRGIQVLVDPDHGVTQISGNEAQPRFQANSFTGQFEGGIRIGDSRESVVKVLGQPDHQDGFKTKAQTGRLIYESKHDSYKSVFRFDNAKLTSMAMFKVLKDSDD